MGITNALSLVYKVRFFGKYKDGGQVLKPSLKVLTLESILTLEKPNILTNVIVPTGTKKYFQVLVGTMT